MDCKDVKLVLKVSDVNLGAFDDLAEKMKACGTPASKSLQALAATLQGSMSSVLAAHATGALKSALTTAQAYESQQAHPGSWETSGPKIDYGQPGRATAAPVEAIHPCPEPKRPKPKPGPNGFVSRAAYLEIEEPTCPE